MHEPIDHPGEGREWLIPESPAAEALRDIIFDKRWQNSLPFYVRNRHTGGLEVILRKGTLGVTNIFVLF